MVATAIEHGGPVTQVAGEIKHSGQTDIDAALTVLNNHKESWVKTGIRDRIALLDELLPNVVNILPRWAEACARAKGVLGTPGEGDEWWFGGLMVRLIRMLRQSLAEIEKQGAPQIPGPVTTRPDGQVVAQVYPITMLDRILFKGMVGEVWMEPGITPQEVVKTQASIYKDKNHPGKIALVLGAGNVSGLQIADSLYKLFIEDQVVLLKPNPVNAYLGALIEEGFRTLIDRGVLRVIYGDRDEAHYAVHHALVEEVHLTGSDKTYEAVVFGGGEEGRRNKAERKPIMTKRFTAELGNISPIIVVPGPWSEGDLAYQGASIASMMTNNAGFMCVAPRVLIQHESWNLRESLLAHLRTTLSEIDTRKAYYPGANDRHSHFMQAHPDSTKIGNGSGDKLPWTLVPVDAGNTDDIAFNTEAWCSLMAETKLNATSIPDYIDQAVEFANDKLWGTLMATVIVHPTSMKDPAVAQAVERAIGNLRYGSIGVNCWGAYCDYLGTTVWGGFPGHDMYDIQSGLGFVNNTLMFEKPQKSVLRASFKVSPNPTLITHKGYREFARKYAHFEANPSWAALPSLIWSAMRG